MRLDDADAVYVGSQEVREIYLGSVKVWPARSELRLVLSWSSGDRFTAAGGNYVTVTAYLGDTVVPAVMSSKPSWAEWNAASGRLQAVNRGNNANMTDDGGERTGTLTMTYEGRSVSVDVTQDHNNPSSHTTYTQNRYAWGVVTPSQYGDERDPCPAGGSGSSPSVLAFDTNCYKYVDLYDRWNNYPSGYGQYDKFNRVQSTTDFTSSVTFTSALEWATVWGNTVSVSNRLQVVGEERYTRIYGNYEGQQRLLALIFQAKNEYLRSTYVYGLASISHTNWAQSRQQETAKNTGDTCTLTVMGTTTETKVYDSGSYPQTPTSANVAGSVDTTISFSPADGFSYNRDTQTVTASTNYGSRRDSQISASWKGEIIAMDLTQAAADITYNVVMSLGGGSSTISASGGSRTLSAVGYRLVYNVPDAGTDIIGLVTDSGDTDAITRSGSAVSAAHLHTTATELKSVTYSVTWNGVSRSVTVNQEANVPSYGTPAITVSKGGLAVSTVYAYAASYALAASSAVSWTSGDSSTFTAFTFGYSRASSVQRTVSISGGSMSVGSLGTSEKAASYFTVTATSDVASGSIRLTEAENEIMVDNVTIENLFPASATISYGTWSSLVKARAKVDYVWSSGSDGGVQYKIPTVTVSAASGFTFTPDSTGWTSSDPIVGSIVASQNTSGADRSAVIAASYTERGISDTDTSTITQKSFAFSDFKVDALTASQSSHIFLFRFTSDDGHLIVSNVRVTASKPGASSESFSVGTVDVPQTERHEFANADASYSYRVDYTESGMSNYVYANVVIEPELT